MGRRKGLQGGRSFFKILIGNFTIQLRIPPVFVKHFRRVFPHKWKICRSGKLWHVEVIKDGNDFFLGDGWSEFVHDNALDIGDLILIKHEGKSKFSVRVYGKNACEKALVLPATRTRRKYHGKKSCEKKMDLAANNTKINHIKQENEHEDTYSEKENILTPLEAFDKYAYKKTFFKIQLRPGHFREKRLYVPKEFAKMMVINESGQTVMLQVADKMWPVKVYLYQNTSGRIYGGWGEFLNDNNLQVGDVCIFELSETINTVINVSLFGPTS